MYFISFLLTHDVSPKLKSELVSGHEQFDIFETQLHSILSANFVLQFGGIYVFAYLCFAYFMCVL